MGLTSWRSSSWDSSSRRELQAHIAEIQAEHEQVYHAGGCTASAAKIDRGLGGGTTI
jgi:hypothetical protein